MAVDIDEGLVMLRRERFNQPAPVLAAQLAAIDASRPGTTLPEIHQTAVRVLCRGMIDLGILEEASYEETQLQLVQGDRVVLYTDGIVEAMNEKEEMFGFERLLEIVNSAGSMSAESLLKEILDRVNKFAGEAKQHDDLTVIVVSVEE